jgi:hypothetical protein
VTHRKAHNVSPKQIRAVGIIAWLSVVTAVVLAGLLKDAPLTVSTAVFLFIACMAPLGVVRLIWRGAPPPTVAEVINTVDRRP